MIYLTKVFSNYQCKIPSEIIEKFNLKTDDIIEWNINENGKTELNFRKKVEFEDVCGLLGDNIPYDLFN